MKLSDLVRERRARAGMIQQDLADKIGVTREAVSQIENGHTEEPSVSVINALARALPVTVRELVTAIGYAIDQDDQRLEAILEDEATFLQNLERMVRRRRGLPNGEDATSAT